MNEYQVLGPISVLLGHFFARQQQFWEGISEGAVRATALNFKLERARTKIHIDVLKSKHAKNFVTHPGAIMLVTADAFSVHERAGR